MECWHGMMNPKSCFAQSAISSCNRQQQIRQDERERERERASASCRAQGFMKKLQKKNTFHKQSRWAWWVPKVCFAQSAISYCKSITTDTQKEKTRDGQQRERERERERASCRAQGFMIKLRKIQQHSRCKKSSRRANTLPSSEEELARQAHRHKRCCLGHLQPPTLPVTSRIPPPFCRSFRRE